MSFAFRVNLSVAIVAMVNATDKNEASGLPSMVNRSYSRNLSDGVSFPEECPDDSPGEQSKVSMSKIIVVGELSKVRILFAL